MAVAKKGDSVALRRALAAGAKIDARDEEFKATVLCFATFYGRSEVVRLLVSAGADVNAKEQCGNVALIPPVVMADTTLLMFAAINGPAATITALTDLGAEVNAQNVLGITALMLAA